MNKIEYLRLLVGIIKGKKLKLTKFLIKILIEKCTMPADLALYYIFLFSYAPFFKPGHKKIFIGYYYGNPSNDKKVLSADWYFFSSRLDRTKFDFFYLQDKFNFFPTSKTILKILYNKSNEIYFSSYAYDKINHLSPIQIKFLKKKLKINTNFVWYDTASKKFFNPALFNLFEEAKNNIIIDNPNFIRHFRYKENNVQIGRPSYNYKKIKSIFNLNFKKTIDVSFIGSVSAYRQKRSRSLQFLEEQNIPITISTADRSKFIPDKDYWKLLASSKITINFSKSMDYHQCKARVFEAIYSECLLLESFNNQICHFFKPGIHFVFFKNDLDLRNKILFFLKNEKIRKKITSEAKKYLLAKYSSSLIL